METTQQFFEAIQTNDVEKVKALLAAEPELVNARTQSGASGVLLATYYNRPAIAQELLLAHNDQLDIFEAAATGQVGRVATLLDEQPDRVNAIAPDGFTPLGLAAFFNHLEAVELLLARGADVNLPSQNAQHVMPLHSSVAVENIAITQALLAHGADVNAVQTDDFTPLLEAAQNGQLAMVQLLLEHGADINARLSSGKTALDVAQEKGHEAVVNFLREHGATTSS